MSSAHSVEAAPRRGPMNLLIGTLIAQGQTLAAVLAKQLRERPVETRTSLAARAPERLRQLEVLQKALKAAALSSPWRDVSRREASAAGLNAVSADPLYARAFQLGWKALRRDAGGTSADDRLWMSPTWELFERWCFVRLAKLLRASLPQLSWTRLHGTQHSARALAAWRGSSPGLAVELLLQVEAPSGDQPPRAGFRSISRERIPDLVLTLESNTGRTFIVLDAKYRAGRPNVLEAMTSAHVYRDALRWHGERPSFALLITPAAADATWLYDPLFHRTERVGATCLDGSLPALVEEAIAAAVEKVPP
jgi:hypothetical protein